MSERPVLIVEDDDAIRTLVNVIARRGGYDTAFATNGQEAISALSDNDYCAVILDLMMPHVDGYDVIRHIKSNAITVPVIVVTAAIATIDWSRMDKSIVKVVLTKPFAIDQLSDALDEVCSGK